MPDQLARGQPDPIVGERPPPFSGPVVLHEPDRAWPTLFASLAAEVVVEILAKVAQARR